MCEPDIEEMDMRAIVRLLGETAALPGGMMGKRCYLLDGLCDLSGAHEWRWELFRLGKDGSPEGCLGFLRRHLHAPFVVPPAWPEGNEKDVDRRHLPFFLTDARLIISRRTPIPAIESRIALCRAEQDLPFTDREIQLASLVLEEIPWLHWQDSKPKTSKLKLPPREQFIFDLLLLGLGRKDIAARLGISEGTVAGYIRNLYRSFGVKSQAALMRCRR